MLNGYKTYIAGIALGAIAFAGHVEWLTPDAAETLTNVILGGGLIALRAGVKKAGH